MTSSVQSDVDRCAGSFMTGDFDAFLHLYSKTLTVYTPGNIYRIAGEDDIRRALHEHRDGALEAGVKGLQGRVVATGLPKGARFRSFVSWAYDMGANQPCRHAAATYYFVRGQHGPRIEMIEYRGLAFRQASRWHGGRGLVQPQSLILKAEGVA